MCVRHKKKLYSVVVLLRVLHETICYFSLKFCKDGRFVRNIGKKKQFVSKRKKQQRTKLYKSLKLTDKTTLQSRSKFGHKLSAD